MASPASRLQSPPKMESCVILGNTRRCKGHEIDAISSSRRFAVRLTLYLMFLTGGSLHAELSQEAFRNPPIQARPSALWTWLNGYVDHKQINLDIAPLAKVGENQLEITVVNTWNNRLVGDAQGDAKAWVTRTNIANKFNANSPLLSSGLLGPVSLKFPVTIPCDLK